MIIDSTHTHVHTPHTENVSEIMLHKLNIPNLEDTHRSEHGLLCLAGLVGPVSLLGH